ncbi:MAG: aromatic ring-hydroxylating oxygenase subunit alpha [Saprospiraceae bacterium]
MPDIHPDIRQAHTLPGSFYTDPQLFEQSKSAVFARSWQLIAGPETAHNLPLEAWPFYFMDGFLEEPLLLLHDAQGASRCLSNVCTHRGKILVERPGRLEKGIICGYHGRRFDHAGRFVSMPETQGMVNFPCAADDLPAAPYARWRQFHFASLEPACPLAEWVAEMDRKTAFLPVETFRFSPERSRDYLVKAHWALYCDNYLEGFHIPFVHKGLAGALDWNAYRTDCYRWSNCQTGISRGGDHVFDLPPGHEDYGQAVSAYYFWLFPNIMFNFYPWGLSLNIVHPIRPDLTKVRFRAYIWDESKLDAGAGAELDLVEREDEAVVEQVQIGVRSRFYQHGRFSPTREQGVHHFHRLIARFI